MNASIKQPRSPFWIALTHPLNLMILGLSVIAGLCAAWWLFPVGILLWAFMVLMVSRDPSIQMMITMEQRMPLAQRFEKPFKKVERGQVGIFRSLASLKEEARRAFDPLQEAVNQLTDEAYNLCLRLSLLENHRLMTKSGSDIDGELFLLQQKTENATDEASRKEYLEALENLKKRQSKLKQMTAQLDRADLLLMSTATTLDGLTMEVIRLQSQKMDVIRAKLPELVATIEKQITEVVEFEQDIGSDQLP